MKKIVAVFLILSTILYANRADELKAILLEAITSVLNGNRNIGVYIQDERYERLKPYFRHIKMVNRCEEAQMVFAKDIKELPKECLEKKIFATRYSTYKKNKDVVMGAFFWQKGRPTILFNKKVLRKFHIVLPDKFKKYEQ